MLITRVELDNIKNYEAGSFEFAPGVTAISGPNGAGKTTILEAISWALFDHLAYKKEDFLKRGAKKGSVRVTFISALDGRESAFELHASGGLPAWRGRLRRNFERYNELANAVLRTLNVGMPEIDCSSIREVPWAPRRTVTPPA